MKLLAFDVETGGTLPEYALQPFRGSIGQGWITSYATALLSGGGTRSDGALEPSVPQLRALLVSCAKHKVRIVGWNTPFDIAWLLSLGLEVEVNACQWLDAMLLWRHLTIKPHYLPPAQAYGLKAAVAEFYPDGAGYAEGIDFADASPEARAKLLEYNKLDALYTLHLAHKFLSLMTPSQKRAALLEAACLPLVAGTYLQGLKIDGSAARALAGELEVAHIHAFAKLAKSSPGLTPAVLASPKQLADLLYTTWGLGAPKLTEKGAESTDKESLQIVALEDERAGWVRDYREAFTNKVKFCEAPLQSLIYNGDGCTRPQAKIFGTYSGRMTYYSTQGKGVNELQTGIAIHQFPRDKRYRSLIAAPEGYDLLEFDFAGQEFRWMAIVANDFTMLEMCAPGEDAHAYMGAQIGYVTYGALIERLKDAKDDAARQARLLGKVANLSLGYRSGVNTLKRMAAVQYNVKLTDEEAAHVHRTYRQSYPGVPKYWGQAIYSAKKNGYAETLAGRRVQLPPPSEISETDLSWALDSTAINFPIQGIGADQKYLALMILRDALPRYEGKFYFELHDGLFVIVPSKHAQAAAVELRTKLSCLPYQRAWGFTPPIGLPVDAKRGKSWGTLERVDG